MSRKNRRDTIAQLLDDAVERAFGDEASEVVFHPSDDFDPHIDVHLLPPTARRHSWRLITLGMSWPMAAARRSGSSTHRPIELLLDLPAHISKKDLRHAAATLQGISEYPFRYGSALGPGAVIPLRDPILTGTDLRGILFGGFCQDELATRIEQELPTHPKLLHAATLTSPERRASETAPLWALWNATISADPGRQRCSPEWLKIEGGTDEEVWALVELSAATVLARKRPADAQIAIREGLRLLNGSGNGEVLANAANYLLLVGRNVAAADKGMSTECFESAAALARRSGADRALMLIDLATAALAGDLSPLQASPTGGRLVTAREQEERLKWLGLSRSVGPMAMKAPPTISRPPEAYEPGPPLDFIIDLKLPHPTKRSELLHTFPQPWFTRNRFPRLRARIADEGRWVNVGTPASGFPERVYDSAQFVLRLFGPRVDPPRTWDLLALQVFVQEIRETVPNLGVELRLEPEAAIAQISNLDHVVKSFSHQCEVVLAAEHGFDGTQVWEVMHAIGLQWGDGDAFNLFDSDGSWERVFMVSTSTEPGYFIPEEIITGTLYKDLIFGFFIPACSNPEASLELVFQAAHRAQAELGGELLFANNEPLDEESLREELRGFVKEMRGLGWPPGAAQTKELFW